MRPRALTSITMTSDGDALFRTICEQPWEDTPRLVYADWLEENGDPLRAEFIRVQVQLAAHPGKFRLELKARAERLHRKSHGLWTRGSPSGPGVRIGRDLQRGFYHNATFEGEGTFAAHADRVFAWTPIDSVWINWLQDDSIQPILASPYLRRLTKLMLSHHCGDVTCRAVADCPHLENLTELHIHGPRTTEAGALALAESPHLARVRCLYMVGQTPLSQEILAT